MLQFVDNKIHNNENGKRLAEKHCAYCAWVTFTVMQIKLLIVVSGRGILKGQVSREFDVI